MGQRATQQMDSTQMTGASVKHKTIAKTASVNTVLWPFRCSACRKYHGRVSHRYCHKCFAAYMRAWRKTHPLTAAQKVKDNARSYAGTYKKRGKLLKRSCERCGSRKS